MEKEMANNALIAAFNKWCDKTWFQILFILVVIYLLVAPIATPIITNHYQQIHTSEAVTKTLDNRDSLAIEAHKLAFEKSKQSYALVKKTMQEYLPLIQCDYAFLIEYHNGAENIMTGIQFCKFDITVEVGDGVMDLVSQEKFRNENIAKYDILLTDELSKDKVMFYKSQDFENVDKYLALQLKYLNAQAYTLISLKDRDNKIFGTLLCVSKDEIMSQVEVMACAREIEGIINDSRL